MTHIAWDGKVLAADSLGTFHETEFTKLVKKIELFEKPVFYRHGKEELHFTAIAFAGEGRFGNSIIYGITEQCVKRGLTLNEYRHEWFKLGAKWPSGDQLEVVLVGLNTTGKPVCGRLVASHTRPVVLDNKGAMYGCGRQGIGFLGQLGLDAVELVSLGIKAWPKYCGGKISVYDPVAHALTECDTLEGDLFELKAKCHAKAAERVTRVFNRLNSEPESKTQED